MLRAGTTSFFVFKSLFETFHLYTFAGATAHSRAYFGEGKGLVNLDLVNCTGKEYILTDCEIGSSESGTSHSLDVGVKCQPGSYLIIRYCFYVYACIKQAEFVKLCIIMMSFRV